MALTNTQKTQLQAVIEQEGGIDAFLDAVRALRADDKRKEALATLAPALSVTVTDWPALQGFADTFRTGGNVALYGLMERITTEIAASDATRLGPLLVAFWAAARGHYGR